MRRRSFILGATISAVACAAGCRSKSEVASSAEGQPSAEGKPSEAKASETARPDAIGPLMAPAALAARIDDVKAGKVAVLYVGPDMLFGRGHVPGARKIGPIDSDEGRRALSAALAQIPSETEIVLYCGCCPTRNCPNVRPASAALRALGRTNAHVLDLPTRFASDWADKGYPVERGET